MKLLLGVALGLILAALRGLRQRRRPAGRNRPGSAAEVTLAAAVAMLAELRAGLSVTSAGRTVEHLQRITQASAIAVADRDRVLAFSGLGEDHHQTGDGLAGLGHAGTGDRPRVEAQIDCGHAGCRLGPAVAAPLMVEGEVIGSVVALYERGREIGAEDTHTVMEAAQLASAFLELEQLPARTAALSEAELRTLRAQISPHFISNALAAIAGLIHTDPVQARDLVTEFAAFLRYALVRREAYVDLADELGYVQTYLALERARFGDRLTVAVEVHPGTLSALVPVLSLQSLVENAVRHGVERRGHGHVEIHVEPRDRDICLWVRDDGVGMSPDRAAAALAGRGGGVGLANVQARLLGSFGPESGLSIDSTPGAGTTVTMRLPGSVPEPVIA